MIKTILTALGEVKDHNVLWYVIEYQDKTAIIPNIMYYFWLQFLNGEDRDEACKGFCEATGLPKKEFDETVDALIKEGIMVQTDKPIK